MSKLLRIGQIAGLYLIYRKLSEYPTATIMKYGLPIATSAFIINMTREKTLAERFIAKVI